MARTLSQKECCGATFGHHVHCKQYVPPSIELPALRNAEAHLRTKLEGLRSLVLVYERIAFEGPYEDSFKLFKTYDEARPYIEELEKKKLPSSEIVCLDIELENFDG